MTGNVRRRIQRIVASALGVAGLVCMPLLASAAPQGPGVHGTEFVDVVPSNHLAGSPSVEVSGKGFPPNAQLAVTECLAVSSGADDCDLSTVDLGVSAGGDGTFGPVKFTVHPEIQVGSRPGTVQCKTDGCALGVGTLDGTYGGSHCLGFGGVCHAAPATPPPSSPAATSPATSRPSTSGAGPTTGSTRPAPTSGASGSSGGGSGTLVVVVVVVAMVVVVVVVVLVVRSRRTRT